MILTQYSGCVLPAISPTATTRYAEGHPQLVMREYELYRYAAERSRPASQCNIPLFRSKHATINFHCRQVETGAFEFRDPKLERVAGLTPADRKWMEDVVNDVNECFDAADPSSSPSIQ
jgi:hypothetical protein